METSKHETLGRYQIEAEVGRGAMGVVYRACDPKIDRTVAIKTISLPDSETSEDLEYRERFVQEARAAGRLVHPGIVTIFDAGEDPETHEPFLVMEYVPGQPLSRVMSENRGRLALGTALQFSYEIAEALEYAHSHGVIHRDIKPANILITEDGHAKIADFGVARLNHVLATHTGKIFGSPAYMAPEQMSGGEADARSDLFSLGVMLYSMITGFRPFQGNSAETVCFKVMNVEPVPVTSFQAEFQPELDRIVSRAIAKVPDHRYQSGAEMADDIRAFMRNDEAFTEATNFFARALQQGGVHGLQPPGREQNVTITKRFMWQAATAVVLVAWIMTGWQATRELRQAATIRPPELSVPHAPAIQKAPEVAKRAADKPALRKKIKPALPASAPEPPVSTAIMKVEILHHFADAHASIWLDSHLVFDQKLRGDDQRHGIFRTVEMHQVASLQLPIGKHVLEVSIVTADKTYDQKETLDIDLTSGPEHVLLLNCDKRKMLVSLQ